jgi:hypothetical protein
MEVILHMLDFMMCDSYSEQDQRYGLCLLKTDIKNCFNSLKRDKLFEILGEHGFGPRMGAVKSLLGHSNTIIHVDYQGQTKIAMQVNDGIFQGSPASGLFVTMAIQHQLADVRSKYLESGDVPGVMFSYLDDITVCADLGTVTSVFPIMKRALAKVGFEVSLEKTTLVTFNTGEAKEQEAAARLGITIEEGSTELLGSVLYSDCQSAVDYLDQLLAVWARQADNLLKYAQTDEPNRLQVALHILRRSFSAKPGYISRCLPPQLTKQAMEQFNQKLVEELLSHIAQVEHSTVGQLHASLPTKLGGLGLVNATDQIYAAYYSSWNDVLKQIFDGAVPTYLVQRFSGLRAKHSSFRWPKRIYDNLNTTRAGLMAQIEQLAELRASTHAARLKIVKALKADCAPTVGELGMANSKLQERVQARVLGPLTLAKVENLLFDDDAMRRQGFEDDELDAVRVKANELKAPGATHWLQVLPVVPDFQLTNEELRATLAHHTLLPQAFLLRLLGLPRALHQAGCNCGLAKGKAFTEQHLAGCGYGGHRTERHDRVVKLTASIVKRAGCSRVQVEPRGLRNYGDKRPDVIYRDLSLSTLCE